MNSQIINRIRRAIEKENFEMLFNIIHDNIRVQEKITGETEITYCSEDSADIIEEISAALVDADAADFFRELCMKDGEGYDLANFPAGGGMSILDLARKQEAKALAEAIESQGGESRLPAQPKKSKSKPKDEPLYLKNYRQALVSGFGTAAAGTIINNLDYLHVDPSERMTRADSIMKAGFTHAINDADENLALSLLKFALKSPYVSPSTLTVMAEMAARESFKPDADRPKAQKLFHVACSIRDAMRSANNPPNYAAAGIRDEVMAANPVIRGVDLG